MDYSQGVSSDKMRFYKDIKYIGVKSDYPLLKNFNDDKTKSIKIMQFSGKPYNKYEYKTYFIYSDRKWNELLKILNDDAKKYNMEVFNNQGIAALGPKWIHNTK